jgi:putative ABC transport system ATP-binding protein
VKPDRAVIVVTHDSRVFHYAHSIAHMDDGQVVEVTRERQRGVTAGTSNADSVIKE